MAPTGWQFAAALTAAAPEAAITTAMAKSAAMAMVESPVMVQEYVKVLELFEMAKKVAGLEMAGYATHREGLVRVLYTEPGIGAQVSAWYWPTRSLGPSPRRGTP
jgi:hypothetical protein